MGLDSRYEAKKLWNYKACGEFDFDSKDINYFYEVEKKRYKDQYWQKNYFKFQEFKNKKVLEIGVGQGTDLMQFAKNGATCFGVDITRNHLEKTALNASLRKLSINLYEADATKLPFENNSLDCVYSFGVLHHIPDVEIVINEIHRVLKPGGSLMIGVYNRNSLWMFHKILVDGFFRRYFLKMNFSGFLSTIEEHADGIERKPYVKLYTKKSVIKLLNKKFKIDNISSWQLHPEHFIGTINKLKLLPLLIRKILYKFFIYFFRKPFENHFGWYVTCISTKR